tara:strand:- start:460 stop:843 length:384 start_codon:yes stop_codon:yes gene_type:complete
LDKNVVLDLTAVSCILAGSTIGVSLRLLVKNKFKKKIGFNFTYISLINFFAALFLGVLLALNFVNKNLILLFYVGFLGCFSTFSSFIYQLFQLLQNREYIRFFLNYIEILIISFIFFFIGFYVISLF